MKSPQRVPATSIKLVRETHTHLLESLTHAANRVMSRSRALRATRYIIRTSRTCARNRLDIAQLTTHAYSNESRWFSSHALEDSCYTHRDFARLMHSCTYPSARFRIGKHGRARCGDATLLKSPCILSLLSLRVLFFFLLTTLVVLLFFVRLRHVSHAVARARKFLISPTRAHCPEIKMRPLR